MRNDLSLFAHHLAKGKLRRVVAAKGKRIECLVGCLWLTQDGDRRDVVLEAGQHHVFDRPGDAIVSALAPSSWLVLDAEASATAPAP